jgi:hypothetical protein
MKNNASKTLSERTKKQHDTLRALQVGYKDYVKQPLSEMSVTPHVSKPHDYVNHMFMRL